MDRGLMRLCVGRNRVTVSIRQRDQALVGQISVRTPGVLVGELGHEFLDTGNDTHMLFLHVEVERAGDRIIAGSDVVERGLDTVDRCAVQLGGVLVEEGIAEDADSVRVGFQFLNDQVVVLTGFDESAVFTDCRAGLAFFFHRFDGFGAGLFHHQFDEGVARAGGRRRAENLDLDGGQGRGSRRTTSSRRWRRPAPSLTMFLASAP